VPPPPPIGETPEVNKNAENAENATLDIQQSGNLTGDLAELTNGSKAGETDVPVDSVTNSGDVLINETTSFNETAKEIVQTNATTSEKIVQTNATTSEETFGINASDITSGASVTTEINSTDIVTNDTTVVPINGSVSVNTSTDIVINETLNLNTSGIVSGQPDTNMSSLVGQIDIPNPPDMPIEIQENASTIISRNQSEIREQTERHITNISSTVVLSNASTADTDLIDTSPPQFAIDLPPPPIPVGGASPTVDITTRQISKQTTVEAKTQVSRVVDDIGITKPPMHLATPGIFDDVKTQSLGVSREKGRVDMPFGLQTNEAAPDHPPPIMFGPPPVYTDPLPQNKGYPEAPSSSSFSSSKQQTTTEVPPPPIFLQAFGRENDAMRTSSNSDQSIRQEANLEESPRYMNTLELAHFALKKSKSQLPQENVQTFFREPRNTTPTTTTVILTEPVITTTPTTRYTPNRVIPEFLRKLYESQTYSPTTPLPTTTNTIPIVVETTQSNKNKRFYSTDDLLALYGITVAATTPKPIMSPISVTAKPQQKFFDANYLLDKFHIDTKLVTRPSVFAIESNQLDSKISESRSINTISTPNVAPPVGAFAHEQPRPFVNTVQDSSLATHRTNIRRTIPLSEIDQKSMTSGSNLVLTGLGLPPLSQKSLTSGSSQRVGGVGGAGLPPQPQGQSVRTQMSMATSQRQVDLVSNQNDRSFRQEPVGTSQRQVGLVSNQNDRSFRQEPVVSDFKPRIHVYGNNQPNATFHQTSQTLKERFNSKWQTTTTVPLNWQNLPLSPDAQTTESHDTRIDDLFNRIFSTRFPGNNFDKIRPDEKIQLLEQQLQLREQEQRELLKQQQTQQEQMQLLELQRLEELKHQQEQQRIEEAVQAREFQEQQRMLELQKVELERQNRLAQERIVNRLRQQELEKQLAMKRQQLQAALDQQRITDTMNQQNSQQRLEEPRFQQERTRLESGLRINEKQEIQNQIQQSILNQRFREQQMAQQNTNVNFGNQASLANRLGKSEVLQNYDVANQAFLRQLAPQRRQVSSIQIFQAPVFQRPRQVLTKPTLTTRTPRAVVETWHVRNELSALHGHTGVPYRVDQMLHTPTTQAPVAAVTSQAPLTRAPVIILPLSTQAPQRVTTTTQPTPPPTADPNPPAIFDTKIRVTFMPMPKIEMTTKAPNKPTDVAGWGEINPQNQDGMHNSSLYLNCTL